MGKDLHKTKRIKKILICFTLRSRIVDLVAWVNTSSGQVVLEWTAVGEDRDWGKAHVYEGFVAPSKTQAATHCTGERIMGLPNPSPAASKEQAKVSITVYDNKGQWICIRAIDGQGNKGPPSNPASLWRPLPPATDRVTIRARGPGGSSLSSGLGGFSYDYGGIAGNEKVALISGSIGGLLVVVLLISLYCYCSPTKFRRRFNRHNSSRNDPEKAGTSLVNGGSVVIKSASRGSVLVNPSPEVGHRADVNSSQEAPRTVSSASNADLSVNGDPPHRQEPDPTHQRVSGDGEECGDRREGVSSSMSIPDVTKVEYKPSRDTDLPSVTAPQFFTLGRSKATSSNRSPLRAVKPDLFQTSEISYAQQPPVRCEPIGAPQYPSPPLFNTVRARQTPPDSSSDGPDDSSLSEQLLCDDRASSPPPPAPADTSHSYSSLHRHSVALT
ncbi:hypothetical protein SK128_013368 [Halocaridina rubra]|uniref:Uncharacterized protein n=1 Tax=Halocaridina rubra TaxID=373956 RepID=A0AAN8WME5_HALRR